MSRGPQQRNVVRWKRRIACDDHKVVSQGLRDDDSVERISVMQGQAFQTQDMALLHRQDTTLRCGKATWKEDRGRLRELQTADTTLDDDLPLTRDGEPQVISSIRQSVPRRFGQPVWRQQEPEPGVCIDE